MSDKQGPRQGRWSSIHRPEYEALREVLSEAVVASGISQREVSRKLGKPPTHINRVLKARRTLEWSELLDLCEALGVNVLDVVTEAMRRSAAK